MNRKALIDTLFIIVSLITLLIYSSTLSDYEWQYDPIAWLLAAATAISTGKFLFDISKEESNYGKNK